MRMVKMVMMVMMAMMVMMWAVLKMRMMRMNWQDSTSPGFLWVFGTRQRTKWGSQL